MNNFGDLINIDEYWDKREQFNENRGWIAYYCKNCKNIVEVEKNEQKQFDFICKECNKKGIVIGTLEWLKLNYKIK